MPIDQTEPNEVDREQLEWVHLVCDRCGLEHSFERHRFNQQAKRLAQQNKNFVFNCLYCQNLNYILALSEQ